MTEQMEGQMSVYDLDLWSGKMSQEHSAATTEKISEPCSKKRQKSQTVMPLFLNLRKANGHTPDVSWEMGGALLGEYTMHSFGECPSEERESRLSQILQGGGAPEILFERKGLSGDITESGKEGKDAATDVRSGVEETGRVAISFQERAGKPGGGKGILIQNERTGALSTLNNQSVCAFEPGAASRVGGHVYENDVAGTVRANAGDNQQAVVCIEGNGSRESHKGNGYVESETMYTLNTIEKHAVCVENHPNDSRCKIREDGKVQTLSGRMGTGGGNVPMVVEPYTSSKASYHQHFTNDGKAETLVASDYKDPPTVTYGLDRAAYNQGMNAQYDFAVDAEKIGTQVAKGPGAVCNNYVVRRLTPMECERLQGFPDYWTDIGDWVDSKGKKHKGDSDSPRYKALGNSIALPFWQWMAKRMRKYLGEHPTMASLFDGIGGFPLSYSEAGVEPVWASEIEEFPIAVTKLRFSKEKNNE